MVAAGACFAACLAAASTAAASASLGGFLDLAERAFLGGGGGGGGGTSSRVTFFPFPLGDRRRPPSLMMQVLRLSQVRSGQVRLTSITLLSPPSNASVPAARISAASGIYTVRGRAMQRSYFGNFGDFCIIRCSIRIFTARTIANDTSIGNDRNYRFCLQNGTVLPTIPPHGCVASVSTAR